MSDVVKRWMGQIVVQTVKEEWKVQNVGWVMDRRERELVWGRGESVGEMCESELVKFEGMVMCELVQVVGCGEMVWGGR